MLSFLVSSAYAALDRRKAAERAARVGHYLTQHRRLERSLRAAEASHYQTVRPVTQVALPAGTFAKEETACMCSAKRLVWGPNA